MAPILLNNFSVKESKGSVTRWLDYLFNIWPFKAMKIYQSCIKVLPNSKSTSNNYQRLLIFCQTVEILANLVTLVLSADCKIGKSVRRLTLKCSYYLTDSFHHCWTRLMWMLLNNCRPQVVGSISGIDILPAFWSIFRGKNVSQYWSFERAIHTRNNPAQKCNVQRFDFSTKTQWLIVYLQRNVACVNGP